MVSVCTGPEFTVDGQNRLRMELAGDPPNVTKPDATPNALRLGETGLWIAPSLLSAYAYSSGSRSVNWVTAPNTVDGEDHLIPITNPTTDRTEFWILVYNVRFQVRCPANTGFTVRSQISSAALTAPVDAETTFNNGTVTRTYWKRITSAISFPLQPTDKSARIHAEAAIACHGAGSTTTDSVLHHVNGWRMVP